MPLQQIRITTIIIAMLVTLGLLLGGQQLYERYLVRDGLERSVAAVAAADAIRVAKDEKPPAVYIRLSHVDDLQSVYQGLSEVIRNQLGPGYRLVLQDDRTPQLQSLYEQCSFPIQQGIATGNFQAMKKGVEQLAAAAAVNCSISVDSDNVYLELRDRNDTACLYQIIPRLSREASLPSGSRGGEGS
jgi:hypothetical protein